MAKQNYNNLIDIIIPAYNVPDNILFRCLSSIACQENINELEVTIVDDASTEQNYEAVAEHFRPNLKINILHYDINGGPGVARQYGLDNTSNGYITFIDADDTFNGSLALKALRLGIELEGDNHVMAVGTFEEIHDNHDGNGPLLIDHENDLVWMFGKMYRRSFIDKYNIRFHESSRANEDTGFNTLCRLCVNNETEKIYFMGSHVYYWHESPNSITRANDCQYSYGSSERDSFYGYTENMIYAYKEARKRNPYEYEHVVQWGISTMFNLYEYYIECASRAPEHAELNFSYCKKYYNEVYSELESEVTEEMFIQLYDEVMTNAYQSRKLEGIIPKISIYEFFDKLKAE